MEFTLGIDRDGGSFFKDWLNNLEQQDTVRKYINDIWSQPISSNFVDRLAGNIIEHEKLSTKFPLYIKFIEVVKIRTSTTV